MQSLRRPDSAVYSMILLSAGDRNGLDLPKVIRPVSTIVLSPELQQEFPFTLRSIQLDGHQYAYVDEGQGPTVLFVHGNPTWSFAWRNLIKGLLPDYRCLAVDHIGMGLSDKPQDYPYRLENHIDNLCRFIEQQDLKEITLVGHDWGGCIGMGAAGRLPDRFQRFVMMNTAAFRSKRIPARIAVCRTPGLGPLMVQGFNAFAGAAIHMAVSHHDRMTPVVKEGFLLPYHSWSQRKAVQRFVEDIPLHQGEPSYSTLVKVEEGLAQFADAPWLFFWGERDWCFTTEFLAEWQRHFPNADVVRFPDAGHYVFEDAHERIVPELKKFLAK